MQCVCVYVYVCVCMCVCVCVCDFFLCVESVIIQVYIYKPSFLGSFLVTIYRNLYHLNNYIARLI